MADTKDPASSGSSFLGNIGSAIGRGFSSLFGTNHTPKSPPPAAKPTPDQTPAQAPPPEPPSDEEYGGGTSSNVAGGTYKPADNILEVGYKKGQRYAYHDVSPDEAHSFDAAGSKGSWVWDNLRLRGTVFGHQKPYTYLGGGKSPKYTKDAAHKEEHRNIGPEGMTPIDWRQGKGPYSKKYGIPQTDQPHPWGESPEERETKPGSHTRASASEQLAAAFARHSNDPHDPATAHPKLVASMRRSHLKRAGSLDVGGIFSKFGSVFGLGKKARRKRSGGPVEHMADGGDKAGVVNVLADPGEVAVKADVAKKPANAAALEHMNEQGKSAPAVQSAAAAPLDAPTLPGAAADLSGGGDVRPRLGTPGRDNEPVHMGPESFMVNAGAAAVPRNRAAIDAMNAGQEGGGEHDPLLEAMGRGEGLGAGGPRMASGGAVNSGDFGRHRAEGNTKQGEPDAGASHQPPESASASLASSGLGAPLADPGDVWARGKPSEHKAPTSILGKIEGWADRQIDKLPKAAAWSVRAGLKTAYATYMAGGALNRATGRQLGETHEQADDVERKAMFWNAVAFKVASFAAGSASAAMGLDAEQAGQLGLVAAFTPWASLGYSLMHPKATGAAVGKGAGKLGSTISGMVGKSSGAMAQQGEFGHMAGGGFAQHMKGGGQYANLHDSIYEGVGSANAKAIGYDKLPDFGKKTEKHVGPMRFGTNQPAAAVPHENLGIPRTMMPQIAKEHLPDFMAQLASKGITSEMTSAPVGTLKPSQNEIGLEKIAANSLKSPKKLGKKVIIVSSDNYIVDGHHGAAGALVGQGADFPMQVMRINAPFADVLKAARAYEKVGYKGVGAKEISYDDPQGHFAGAHKPQALSDISPPRQHKAGGGFVGAAHAADGSSILGKEFKSSTIASRGSFYGREKDQSSAPDPTTGSGGGKLPPIAGGLVASGSEDGDLPPEPLFQGSAPKPTLVGDDPRYGQKAAWEQRMAAEHAAERDEATEPAATPTPRPHAPDVPGTAAPAHMIQPGSPAARAAAAFASAQAPAANPAQAAARDRHEKEQKREAEQVAYDTMYPEKKAAQEKAEYEKEEARLDKEAAKRDREIEKQWAREDKENERKEKEAERTQAKADKDAERLQARRDRQAASTPEARAQKRRKAEMDKEAEQTAYEDKYGKKPEPQQQEPKQSREHSATGAIIGGTLGHTLGGGAGASIGSAIGGGMGPMGVAVTAGVAIFGKLTDAGGKLKDTFTGLAIDPKSVLSGLASPVHSQVAAFNPATTERFALALDNCSAAVGRFAEPIIRELTGFADEVNSLLTSGGEDFRAAINEVLPPIRDFARGGLVGFVGMLRDGANELKPIFHELAPLGHAAGVVLKELFSAVVPVASTFASLYNTGLSLMGLTITSESVVSGLKSFAVELIVATGLIKDWAAHLGLTTGPQQTEPGWLNRFGSLWLEGVGHINDGIGAFTVSANGIAMTMDQRRSEARAQLNAGGSPVRGDVTYAAQAARHVGVEEIGMEARRSAFSQGESIAQQTATNTAATVALLQRIAGLIARGNSQAEADALARLTDYDADWT